MAKASVYIVLFLISVNAGAVMLEKTGVAADLGVDMSTDKAAELETAEAQADQYGAGSGAGSTLFGLYASLAGVLETVFNGVMPAAAIMKRAGVDKLYVHFAFAFLAMVPVFDTISFLRSGGSLY